MYPSPSAILLLLLGIATAFPVERPVIAWELRLPEDREHHQSIDALHIRPDGSAVAIVRVVAVETKDQGHFQVLEMDAEGRATPPRLLLECPPERRFDPIESRVQALSVDADDLRVLGRFTDDLQTEIATWNTAEGTVTRQPLRHALLIATAQWAADGTLWCGGLVDGDACVIQTDAGGAVLQEFLFDYQQTDQVADLAVQADGSWLMVVESGMRDKFGLGPAQLVVVRCQADGTALVEQRLPGRAAQLAVAGDAAWLFYDSRFDQGSAHRIRCFASDSLGQRWETKAPLGRLWVYQPCFGMPDDHSLLVAGYHDEEFQVDLFAARSGERQEGARLRVPSSGHGWISTADSGHGTFLVAVASSRTVRGTDLSTGTILAIRTESR